MSLASLFNTPSRETDFLQFSFHNQDHHVLIVNALAGRGIGLPLYALDPISPADPANWLRLHQEAHNGFTAALGIDGVDLTDVDFRDPEQLASWVRLHGEEHRQAADRLGLSDG